MDRLDQEIAQLNEHLEVKETRKVEFRNNLEVLERSKVEYGAALELIRAISREGERMRELVGKLREQASKMEGVKMDMDELESELREAQQQVSHDIAFTVRKNPILGTGACLQLYLTNFHSKSDPRDL